MSNPHLRVDDRDQTLDLGVVAFWTFEATSKMQSLDVTYPSEQDLIVGPLALHDDIKLVVAGTLELPYVTGRHVLDDFERVSTMTFGRSQSCHRGISQISTLLPCPLLGAATQTASSVAFRTIDGTSSPNPA